MWAAQFDYLILWLFLYQRPQGAAGEQDLPVIEKLMLHLSHTLKLHISKQCLCKESVSVPFVSIPFAALMCLCLSPVCQGLGGCDLQSLRMV